MKLHILSDLHLEISGMPDYKPPEDIDLVILAGDIHTASRGLDWAAETFDQTKTFMFPATMNTTLECLSHGVTRYCENMPIVAV